MKKIRKFISSPKGTMAAFGAAVVLLLLSTIGGARAALVEISENHTTQIETRRIGVSLVEETGEEGSVVKTVFDNKERGKLLNSLVKDGEKVKAGVKYPEKLSVQNTSEIDQYVRVTIYKYWVRTGKSTDDKGNEITTETKVKNVYPGYIDLDLKLDNGWVVDPKASTQERTVIYYTGILKNDGNPVEFANGLTIDPKVTTTVSKNSKTGEVTYDYKGLEFRVDVNVDAVQTHNAADAILSTWGCKVNNDNAGEDGVLSSLEFEW